MVVLTVPYATVSVCICVCVRVCHVSAHMLSSVCVHVLCICPCAACVCVCVQSAVLHATGGAPSRVADAVHISTPWKALLSDPVLVASLGLSPPLVEYVRAQFSSKLAYAMAPTLCQLFEVTFDPPNVGDPLEVHFTQTHYTTVLNNAPQTVTHVSFAVGDETHTRMRTVFWEAMEAAMRVHLSIKALDADENGEATCWICASSYRIGATTMWVDLTGCCRQALCIDCLATHLSLPSKGSFKLWPGCPFCNAVLGPEVLRRVDTHGCPRPVDATDEQNAILETYTFLQTHVAGHAVGAVPDSMRKGWLFSRCLDCGWTIPTKMNCARDRDDLPTACGSCLPKGDLKQCPKCRIMIERIDGCNNVDCYCGQAICWLCGSGLPVSHDREHFSTSGFYGDDCILTCGRKVVVASQKEGRAARQQGRRRPHRR